MERSGAAWEMHPEFSAAPRFPVVEQVGGNRCSASSAAVNAGRGRTVAWVRVHLTARNPDQSGVLPTIHAR
jgi:hypothetical protein